jgi:hypothetical protein
MRNKMKRIKMLIIITLLNLNGAISAEPDFIWSKDFFGDGNSNTRTLPIRRLDGNNEGFVGATGNAVPRRFIDSSGNLECHILVTYQEWILSSSGSIYNSSENDSCPLF